jgi:hypothetical protein
MDDVACCGWWAAAIACRKADIRKAVITKNYRAMRKKRAGRGIGAIIISSDVSWASAKRCACNAAF